jgi:hypothetical protein
MLDVSRAFRRTRMDSVSSILPNLNSAIHFLRCPTIFWLSMEMQCSASIAASSLRFSARKQEAREASTEASLGFSCNAVVKYRMASSCLPARSKAVPKSLFREDLLAWFSCVPDGASRRRGSPGCGGCCCCCYCGGIAGAAGGGAGSCVGWNAGGGWDSGGEYGIVE